MSNEGVPQEILEQLAAEQGPRWPDRKAAWLDGYREGAQHARLSGAAHSAVRRQVLAEVREALLLDDGPRVAADAVWAEIDGPLGRASMDESFKKLSDRDKDAIRFISGAAAVLAPLSSEETS